jgi:small subunit ribosomal protein S21
MQQPRVNAPDSGLNLPTKAFRGRNRNRCRLCGAFFFLPNHGRLGVATAPSRQECGVWVFMQIMVRENNVDQALRALKKKLQREGVYREMKLRRHFEKPSEKRAREKAAAVRRARKMERKQQERDGVK